MICSMDHQIVVLDGYTLNPGDLSWERLEQIAPTTVYHRTAPDEVVERAAGATIVLTNKTPLDGDTLRRCPASAISAFWRPATTSSMW